MAEPVVRIEPTRVSVAPGEVVTVLVTVYNPGHVVEGYDVDVVAEAAIPWATPSPSSLSVYPQQEATTLITFAPPEGPGAPGGSFPFGVRIRSQVDFRLSAVAEGDLDVASRSGLQASLSPVTSSGRWRGNHTLKVDNWGNAPALLRIVAKDEDQQLGFLVSPQSLDVPIGGQGHAMIKVRTRHPVLRGTPRRLPFKVLCDPDVPAAVPGPSAAVSSPERPVLDAGFNQKPILSRWVVLGAALLLLSLIAMPLWWWQRQGPGTEAEELALPPAQPTNLVSTVAPGVITLNWDRVSDADGYEIEMTRPANETKPANAQPLPDDDTRVGFAMETDRSDQHCYVVFAVKEGAPKSPGSEPRCQAAVLTPEQAQRLAETGPPTTPATIEPAPAGDAPEVPPEESASSSSPTPPESGTPSVDPSGTPLPSATPSTGSPPPATEPSIPPPTGPPAFIVPLKFYTADLGTTSASADHLVAVQNRLPATLAQNKDLATGLPEGLPLVLYVGAATETEALAACIAAKQIEPFTLSALCVEAYPFTAPPVPTATGAAALLEVAHANIYAGVSQTQFAEDLTVVLADSPDVVTLNETYTRSREQLSPPGYAVWRAEEPRDARETPVLWRTDSWELLDQGTQLMHSRAVKWGTRYANWVTLRSTASGSIVSVISGHASPGGPGRDGLLHEFVTSLDQLVAELAQLGTVIVGADLNTDYSQSGFLPHWLSDSGALSTFDTLGEPAGGWATGTHRGGTIDYILVTGAQPVEHATRTLPYSDHRLLTAYIQLP